MLPALQLYNEDTYFYPFFMKDSCCSGNAGLGAWCHPNLVKIVAGVIMMTAGIGKFLWGSAIMAWVGGAALGIFGVDATGSLANVAITLGFIAATIEVLWGLLFALGCRKTSKYAALGLAIVMLVALLTKVTDLKPVTGSGFQMFAGVLSQIQFDLLLLALFVQKSLSIFMCSASSCCGGMSMKK